MNDLSDPPLTNTVWAPQEGPQHALVTCPHPEVFFGGARGGGKCLPLDEPVLTPFGWRPIGEIEVGQQVCNPDGSVSRVISTYRPGSAPVYRLRFSDGAEIRCDDDHIWLGSFVSHRLGRGLKRRLYTLRQVRAKYGRTEDPRFLIPLTMPVVFTRPRTTRHGDQRPIDPYLLGVLLGDGSLTQDSVRYSTVDPEIDAYCARFGELRIDDGPNRRLVNCSHLVAALKQLGVWGHRAETKRIPPSYLWADVETRWGVLQGLMDTDGTADHRGQCYFASASPGLSEDVQWLARSLGFKASVWVKETTRLPSHAVYIRGPERARLFCLERKAQRARRDFQVGHSARRLVSIEPDGEAEVACFRVDNPNGLFVGRDFVVTHNTDGVLGKWAWKASLYGERFNAMMFRRTTVSSEDAIERSKEIYGPLGARFHESKYIWRMPGGGRVSFAYLDSVDDAAEYQGRNVTDAWVEEAGQFADSAPIDRLYGVLRSAHGVPVQLILTANPGGVGQHWIARRYGLIPFPVGPQLLERTLPDGARHTVAVIPSRITDNRILLENDPGYVSRLQLVGSAALVRAWLEGDWSAIEGAFFDVWDPARHIVDPFAIPRYWLRFRSFDWGSAKPFSVGWWAVAGEDVTVGSGHGRIDGEREDPGNSRVVPAGALVRYREWYGAERPDVGLRLTTQDVAAGILARDGKGEEFAYSVADPSIFAEDGGPSRAEIFGNRGVWFTKADNRRIPGAGHMGGWDEVRQRLKGEGSRRPMLVVFSTCRDFIRTVPVLPHDPKHPEDLDTTAEDHIADETRYACMSRPWTRTVATVVPQKADDYRAPRERSTSHMSY